MVIKSRMRDVNHTNFKVEDVVVGDEVCIFNVRLNQRMTPEVKQYVCLYRGAYSPTVRYADWTHRFGTSRSVDNRCVDIR